MPAPTLSTLVLAVGPDIWSFPAWKQRTADVIPPFYKIANPATTHLDSWQLTVIRNLSKTVHSLPTFKARVRYIQDSEQLDTTLSAAVQAWHTWAEPLLPSWNIQTDIEALFHQFDCHPSQSNTPLVRL